MHRAHGSMKGAHAVLLLCGVHLATACTVLELTGAGFAANAVHVFHAYTLFAENNGTIYLDSTAFEYKCTAEGGWQEFFSFDAAQGRLASYSPEVERRESCARYTFHDIDLMLHTMHYDWFSIDVDAAQQVWTFSNWVQQQLDSELGELAQMASPRIAFHIRGGDKLSEDEQLSRLTTQPKDFIDAFMAAHPGVKGGTCLMVGDDRQWIAEASKLAVAALGCAAVIEPLFHVPTGGAHDQETFNHEPYDIKCAGTLQFLLDIELLNRADYFVGTTNSGLPHLIDVLRFAVYSKDRGTFVDASFRHQDWYSRMMRFWSAS